MLSIMSQMWPWRYWVSFKLSRKKEKSFHLLNFYAYPGNTQSSCSTKGAGFESFEQKEKDFLTRPEATPRGQDSAVDLLTCS